ncbi:MAG: hypothetical protein HYW65_02465 [Candidatus Liptonbacteria bacterium]|nr:hypothetical protein [Candidatus Liptonbacteria bacterium]
MKDLWTIAIIFQVLAAVGILVAIIVMIFGRGGGGTMPPPADTSASEVQAL